MIRDSTGRVCMEPCIHDALCACGTHYQVLADVRVRSYAEQQQKRVHLPFVLRGGQSPAQQRHRLVGPARFDEQPGEPAQLARGVCESMTNSASLHPA